MEELQLFRGDALQIFGKTLKSTVCIVFLDETCARGKIRLNKAVRQNLQVGLGDYVCFQECFGLKYGKRVHVLPTVPINDVDVFDKYLKSYFFESYRPLSEGDTFVARATKDSTTRTPATLAAPVKSRTYPLYTKFVDETETDEVCAAEMQDSTLDRKSEEDSDAMEFIVIATDPDGCCIVAPDTFVHYRGDYELFIKKQRIIQEQNECARNLQLLFDVEENYQGAVGRVMIAAVVNAMKSHGGSEKVQLYGCRALGNMCHEDAENRRLTRQHGAIDAVVNAMKKYGGSEKVQLYGCHALMNMCHEDAESRRDAALLDAFHIVFEALKQYASVKSKALELCAQLAKSHVSAQSEKYNLYKSVREEQNMNLKPCVAELKHMAIGVNKRVEQAKENKTSEAHTKIEEGAIKRYQATQDQAEPVSVESDVVRFAVVNGEEIDLEEKNLVDAWLFANREDVNMFGDKRGTKYEFATPLRDGDGGRKNDKYAWITSRNPTKPWIVPYPKHWGREPDRKMKDYVQFPGGYGFGSSTTKAWIEENTAADEAAKAAAQMTPVKDVKDETIVQITRTKAHAAAIARQRAAESRGQSTLAKPGANSNDLFKWSEKKAASIARDWMN